MAPWIHLLCMALYGGGSSSDRLRPFAKEPVERRDLYNELATAATLPALHTCWIVQCCFKLGIGVQDLAICICKANGAVEIKV